MGRALVSSGWEESCLAGVWSLTRGPDNYLRRLELCGKRPPGLRHDSAAALPRRTDDRKRRAGRSIRRMARTDHATTHRLPAAATAIAACGDIAGMGDVGLCGVLDEEADDIYEVIGRNASA